MARSRPSVFAGSSAEGLKIAKALQVLLDHVCEVTIWSQGVFLKTKSNKSKTTMASWNGLFTNRFKTTLRGLKSSDSVYIIASHMRNLVYMNSILNGAVRTVITIAL